MRIADILFSNAVPGAYLVDLTAESAGLSTYAALAPELGLPYQRGLSEPREGAPLALILHSLPTSGQEAAEAIDFAVLRGLAQNIAHVVFFDVLEAFLENGVIDVATRSRFELVSTHRTDHRTFRFATVFRRPDEDRSTAQLRLVSEYRFDKLLLSEVERERDRSTRERDDARRRLADLRAANEALRAEREQLHADHQQLRTENKLLESECRQLIRARDLERTEAAARQEELKAYQSRLMSTFQILERSRRSFGFRVGLATWAAASRSGKNVFAMPRRWFRSFRGPDEVLERFREVARLGVGSRQESRAEMDAIAKSVLLLGLPTETRSGPGVAGVVGPRFGEELRASARFRALAPHNWRHLLETETPAYVLVTADGLQPGTPWAGWGTPGGRDGSAQLRELVGFCHAIGLPIIYWDTVGTGRRLPAGLRFDAVFSVSHRPIAGLGSVAEVLLPGIEPLVWNPVAVPLVTPRNPIHVGAFDRRGDRTELAALEAILRAAAGRGLELLDTNSGLQGPAATTVAFPGDLRALARRRPPAEAERIAIKRAGIAICGHPVSHCDFPSWDLLRALAMGVHVLSTPLEFQDDRLAAAIEVASDAASAVQGLDRLSQRTLLDTRWRDAFDHLMSHYSLRDRLARISARCGAAPVADPQPSVAVIARVRTAAEARELRGFLAAQTAAPAEVRVLLGADVEGDEQLSEVVDPSRIRRLRAGDPQESSQLGDSGATHLLCWSAGTPAVPEAIAELTCAASLTATDVLVLASEAVAPGAELYRYGPLPPDGVVAIRRDSAAEHLRNGSLPEAAAAALAGSGTGCLIKSRTTVNGPASQRSVA